MSARAIRARTPLAPTIATLCAALIATMIGPGAASTLMAQPPRRDITAQAADSIVRTARIAFDGGQAVPLRARLRATLQRNPADRAARLGLATLDYQQALFARADSAYSALLRDAAPADPIATQAWLGRSAVAGQQARYAEADSFTVIALDRARRTQDPYGTTLALVRLAQFRTRTAGVPTALALLAAADSFAPRVGAESMAGVACIRAQTRGFASDTLAVGDALRGISLLDPARRSRLRATCLFTIGQQYFRRGSRYADSASHYFRLTAAEQTGLQDWAGRAAAQQWLGATLQAAGQYAAARRAFDAALVDGLRGSNQSARAWALLGLGTLHADLGDDVTAARQLTQAAGIMQRQGDQFGFQGAQLALLRLRLRRADTLGVAAALPTTEAALRRLGDQLAHQRGLAIGIDLARARGDHKQARLLAEALWTQHVKDKRTIDVDYAHVRGTAALEAGDLLAADAHFVVPDGALPARLGTYALLARSAEVAAKRGNLALAERRLREAHARFFEFRSRLREPELRLTALQSAVIDQVDPDLGVATVLNALAVGGRSTAAFAMAAERHARALTDALMRATALDDRTVAPSITRARATEATTSESDVRAALGASEAMLFYVTGARNEPTTLFVLTRDRLSAVSVASADSLAPLVARLRRLVESGLTAEGIQRQLGNAVMAPALPLLPAGISRLLIVGDGPLQSLPFDVLTLPDGRVLLDRFDVAMLASPAVLPLLRARTRPTGSGVFALALGQPGRRSPVNGALLPALRRAGAEARAASATQPRSTLLIGDAAREAVLYDRADTVSTLHIAAHAVIDPSVASRSAIMLARGNGHDGDVHSWELDRLRISAGLVVLSACRTADADGFTGDGLGGFTAPLLLGGTQAVIATQWDLSDRVAEELMREFHRRLADGADAGSALRDAKQLQRKRGRSAAQWAVFQLIGDPAYRVPRAR